MPPTRIEFFGVRGKSGIAGTQVRILTPPLGHSGSKDAFGRFPTYVGKVLEVLIASE